jgi:hypothetical protein
MPRAGGKLGAELANHRWPSDRETAVSEPRDYIELSLESIQCFANDGKLDAAELGKLIAIAERDGVFDPNEIRVLHNIIRRIRPHEVDAAMQAQLTALAQKIGLKQEATAQE